METARPAHVPNNARKTECPVTCKCDKCPVKGTFKCPKKELEDRAYYFKTLLEQEQKKKVVKK